MRGSEGAAGAGHWAWAARAGVASRGTKRAPLPSFAPLALPSVPARVRVGLPLAPGPGLPAAGRALSGAGSWPCQFFREESQLASLLALETRSRFFMERPWAGPLVGMRWDAGCRGKRCPRPGGAGCWTPSRGVLPPLILAPGAPHPQRPPLCSRGCWNL